MHPTLVLILSNARQFYTVYRRFYLSVVKYCHAVNGLTNLYANVSY
jgi:hypothetical protein